MFSICTSVFRQASLFESDQDPSFDPDFKDLRRAQLEANAWIDYAPSWLSGQKKVFGWLESEVNWRKTRRRMYEREVDTPRLLAQFPQDGPIHSIIPEMERSLSQRYRQPLVCRMAAFYRDGRDSVAWHRDRDGPEATVALVSLGARRRFLLRPTSPRDGRGSRVYWLGWGDLLVMGPGSQRAFEHCVPKVTSAEPRMVLMFRQPGSD